MTKKTPENKTPHNNAACGHVVKSKQPENRRSTAPQNSAACGDSVQNKAYCSHSADRSEPTNCDS